MNKRNAFKPFTLIHLWWFVAIIAIIVAGTVIFSINNTNKIIERAQENEQYTSELFSLLKSEPKWILATDSLGRTYIDSIRDGSSANDKRIESFLLKETSRQLSEYSSIITQEAAALNNSLMLWAGLLTTISVIFTFFGFMELRSRLNSVDQKGIEMDSTINEANEIMDTKLEEIHDALESISDRRDEIERIQKVLNNLSVRLDEVSHSSIIRITDKERQITDLYKEVKSNTLLSTYNLHLQLAQNKADLKDRIAETQKLIESISLNKALSKDNKDKMLSECYLYIGLSYVDMHDIKSAIEAYTHSIELYPNAVVLNNRGLLLQQKSQFIKALNDFNKAIELSPNTAIYFSNKGSLQLNRGFLTDALEAFNKAVELAPTESNFLALRADTYTALNDVENAFSDYSAAIILDPENDLFYYKRGYLYHFIEQNNLALTDYLKAIKLNPNISDYYCGRGIIYMNIDEYGKALNDFNKAIDLDYKNPEYYINRADLYTIIGEYDNAFADYSKAIELDSNKADYYVHRGNTYSELDDLDNALKDFSKAIEIDKKNVKAYYNQGLAFIRQDETDMGKQSFEKCIQLDTNNKLGYKVKSQNQIDTLKNKK